MRATALASRGHPKSSSARCRSPLKLRTTFSLRLSQITGHHAFLICPEILPVKKRRTSRGSRYASVSGGGILRRRECTFGGGSVSLRFRLIVLVCVVLL